MLYFPTPHLFQPPIIISQNIFLPPIVPTHHLCFHAGTDAKGKPSGIHKPAVFSVMDLEPEDDYCPPSKEGDNVIVAQTGASDQLKSEIKSVSMICLLQCIDGQLGCIYASMIIYHRFVYIHHS